MKIKNKMIKILGIIASVALLLSNISITTNAANASLPDSTKTGSITIHKYALDSLSDANGPATGLQDDSQVPASAKKLPGITFKIYKVADTITDVSQITDSNKGTAVQTVTTGDGNSGTTLGVATASSLALGKYYVEEVATSAVTASTAPFLVDVPMTNPTNGNEWIYDVHVYPKNVLAPGPTIDKSVTTSGNKDDSANIGSNETWIIEPTIPLGVETSKQYIITDSIDSRLDYTGFVGISFKDTSNQIVTLTKGTDYILTEPVATGGGTLKIEFTQTGKTKLAAGTYEGQTIETKMAVKYTTKINNTATLGEPIYNGASINYTNALDVSKTPTVPDSLKPEVHTGGVLLEKVDATNNSIKLQGAKFKVYPTLADAQAGTNAILSTDGTTNEWEITTDSNGQAIFSGLKYGNSGDSATAGSTDYYIVETQAPMYDSNGDGTPDKAYNLLSAPFKVTVNATSHLDANKILVKDSKFTLPKTGGLGTLMFTFGGIILMGTASVLYIKSRKKA